MKITRQGTIEDPRTVLQVEDSFQGEDMAFQINIGATGANYGAAVIELKKAIANIEVQLKELNTFINKKTE